MIARVRIAPVERWCECLIEKGKNHPRKVAMLPGQPIEIRTETMRTSQDDKCGGRVWTISEESHGYLFDLVGHHSIVPCEHMLEMD